MQATPTHAALSLSALLSQALVAFTIEFDNEFEHRSPHRTTLQGSSAGATGPWLVSMAMWFNCLQFIGEDGVRAGELSKLARTTSNLKGMYRWGYIMAAPDPADKRPKPPLADWVIRTTAKGRKAQLILRPLSAEIEERWQTRFGKDHIQRLREALWSLIRQIDVELPDCLPILGYGLFSKGPKVQQPLAARDDTSSSQIPFPGLLARVLLLFAMEFEREPDLSLAISANVLRILDAQGVRVRDLPILSGVSKEAISMAMGILRKKSIAVIEPDPNGTRAQIARLTAKGHDAQAAYRRRLAGIEQQWETRFGSDTIRNLREPLESLVGDATPGQSPLFRGLEPYPDGWRALVRKPKTLPHYPMVLHRGGYPDGS